MAELEKLPETSTIKDVQITEQKKIYKTPEYTRRANKKYALKKKDDPEFRKKMTEIHKNYQINNKDKMREYKRNYMRKYRDKKKAEKAVSETTTPSTDITDTIDAMNSLVIKN
jgi:hypothetical protein